VRPKASQCAKDFLIELPERDTRSCRPRVPLDEDRPQSGGHSRLLAAGNVSEQVPDEMQLEALPGQPFAGAVSKPSQADENTNTAAQAS